MKFMLSEKYKKEIIPLIKKKFNYSNINLVPRMTKAVVNVGIGKYSNDDKIVKEIEHDLTLITGQKPEPRRAKKSIAGFKLREGMLIGYRIVLRRKRMYDFLERLIGIALPRSRDFRGLDLKNVDQAGNLNIGIKEQIIFTEVANSRLIFGFEVAIVTNSSDRETAVELYRALGFPLKKVEIKKGKK
ncbi:50S ribosomal protein L5 [Candidatus Azambacteria bacterium]|nr:50S ribosomal protein L5 [Candidatus Azambacteria bacterium]